MFKFVLAFAFVSPLLAVAEHPEYAFQFEVVVLTGNDPLQKLTVDVLPNTVKTVKAARNLELEFTTPAYGASQPPTIVRLVRIKNGERFILHTSKTQLGSTKVQSRAYTVCGEDVTFMSPAPEEIPDCGR